MFDSALAPTQEAAPQNERSGGRETFEIQLARGMGGLRRYKVFCYDQAMLLLDLGSVIPASQKTGALVGGLMFGAIGASVGSSLGKSMAVEQTWERRLQNATDDQIMAIARERKHSLVIKTDEVLWARVETSNWFGAMFQPKTLVGWVSMKDTTYGRLKLEIHDVMSMNAATEALSSILGERAEVKVFFDPTSCTYRSSN